MRLKIMLFMVVWLLVGLPDNVLAASKTVPKKSVSCACEQTFKKPYAVEWVGRVSATFVGGADFGVRRAGKGAYRQFYVSADGAYDVETGQLLRVKGKLVGITCSYANTVFGECVGEVVPSSVEKIK